MSPRPPLVARVLLAAALLGAGGCATWDAAKWDLTRYRDPRASDIDKRMTERPSPVDNPFGSAGPGR